MGRQHVKNERLSIRRQKTGQAADIAILPELRAVLDATHSDHLTFLVTAQVKPFTAAGFGNWFQEMRTTKLRCRKFARLAVCAKQQQCDRATPAALRMR